MKRCQGIGEMLEDDVEHIHQMAVSTDIKMKIELSQQCPKQGLKWRIQKKILQYNEENKA